VKWTKQMEDIVEEQRQAEGTREERERKYVNES
jgi:hypothetical protein